MMEKATAKHARKSVASRQRLADKCCRTIRRPRTTPLKDKRKVSRAALLPGSTVSPRNGSRSHCYPSKSLPRPATAIRTLAFLIAPLVAGAGNVAAQALDGRALAAGCATCHRPGASTIPSLQGRSRDELLKVLRTFREGSRSGTVMPQLARGYTDAQLEAIAAWYAMQSKGTR